ncbi:hypothetical protein APS56_14225 [Pseudalgibacter alginicilyticus]|uniref:Uncharacterized protein n=1 Tax=Pseudalgibacter alginicilyticus TaxID=1736674 RepID=A0A0P0D7W5_9FLAO|nr:hypothetical protein [Pseudalgibacter alginicilyticus]ALJ06219.1 hypothetical protein APS56_14225 [Pseudalgibacter alginicilyticus]
MKRYRINQIEFPDWKIKYDEKRMGWYNINGVRTTGNIIGIDGTSYDDGIKRISTDIVNFELAQSRTISYWNKVFLNLLELNKIPFSCNKTSENYEKEVFSWSIEILECIYLNFDSNDSEIQLMQNSELLFSKKWNEFVGNDFYDLIMKINFRF